MLGEIIIRKESSSDGNGIVYVAYHKFLWFEEYITLSSSLQEVESAIKRTFTQREGKGEIVKKIKCK